jgi:hypothetical protein
VTVPPVARNATLTIAIGRSPTGDAREGCRCSIATNDRPGSRFLFSALASRRSLTGLKK